MTFFKKTKPIVALKSRKKLCWTNPKTDIVPIFSGKRMGQSVTATARNGPGIKGPKKIIGKNTEFSTLVDSSLIGGLKLRIDNVFLDASIKTKMENLRKDLIQQ